MRTNIILLSLISLLLGLSNCATQGLFQIESSYRMIQENPQDTPMLRQDDKILSKDYAVAKAALNQAIEQKDKETIRKGLKNRILLLNQKSGEEIIAAVMEMKDITFVPNLVEALRENQGILGGGTETTGIQFNLNELLINALNDLTGLNFKLSNPSLEYADEYTKYSDEIEQIIERSMEWIKFHEVEIDHLKQEKSTVQTNNQVTESNDLGKLNINQEAKFQIADRITLLDERKTVISKLIGMANKSSQEIDEVTFFQPQDSLPNLIMSLEDLRAVESIPLLNRIKGKVALEQATSRSRRESVSVFDYFFAAKALSQIGIPSASPVLSEITDDKQYSTLNNQLNALIISEIYGKEISLHILNGLDQKKLSEQSKRKIAAAKETIEKYDVVNWYFDGQELSPALLTEK